MLLPSCCARANGKKLGDLARLPSVRAGLAKRARIVLLAADGMPNARDRPDGRVSRPTVIAWREGYSSGGFPGSKTLRVRVGPR